MQTNDGITNYTMNFNKYEQDFVAPIKTVMKQMTNMLKDKYVTIEILQTLSNLSAEIKKQSEMVLEVLESDAYKVDAPEFSEFKHLCYNISHNYYETYRRKKKRLDSLITLEKKKSLINDFLERSEAHERMLYKRAEKLRECLHIMYSDKQSPELIQIKAAERDKLLKDAREYREQTFNAIISVMCTNRINPFYEIADTLEPVFNFSRKKQKRLKGIDSLMKKKRKYKKAPKTYQDFFVEKEEAAKFADFLRSYAKTNKNGLCPGDVYKLYVECLQRLKLLNTTAFHLSYKTFGDLLSQLNTNGVIIYKYKGCSIKFGSPYDSDFIKALDAFVALRG